MKQIALAIIENKQKGTILLQHRDEHAPNNACKWGLWGGAVEHDDESCVHAICRELLEELQITVAEKDAQEILNYEYTRPDGGIRDMHIFYIQHSDDYHYVQCEGDDMKFFTREEIKKLEPEICPVTKIALWKYLSIE